MSESARPRLRTLARAWFDVGTQSVGGGASTLVMIRRVFVDKHHWLTHRDVSEGWSFTQLSPGIHLVALCGTFGLRIAGRRGLLVSVASMMVPAALITAVLAALYERVAALPAASAALAGAGPVAGGMSAGVGVAMMWSIHRHGRRALVDGLLVLVALAASLLLHVDTVSIIVISAVVGALFLGRERPTTRDAPMS